MVTILVSCGIKKNIHVRAKFEELRAKKLKELKELLKKREYLKAKALIWDISLLSQCLDEPEFSIFVGKKKITLVSNCNKPEGGERLF